MALALSGLASGLDSASLITQLMEVERAPRTRLALDQVRAEARKTALQGVADRVATLRTASEALRASTTWAQVQKVSTSDATSVTATITGTAAVTDRTIEVTQLARAEQRTYTFAAPASGESGDLTVGGQTVAIPAGATLQETVAAINARTDLGVTAAAAVDAQGNPALVLSSRTSGAASGFTASRAGLTEDTGIARAGQDLRYRFDGEATYRTSATNVLTGVLPGLDLTVRKVTTGTTIGVEAPAADADLVASKLQAFTTAYNALTDFVRAKLSEKVVPGATTSTDAAKGVLFGDRTLDGMLRGLRQAVSTPVDGNATSLDQLAELGVAVPPTSGGTSSTDALAGRLTFTRATLDTALLANPDAVQRLAGGTSGIDGLSQRLGALLGTDGATGVMTGRLEAATSQISRITSSITAMDDRLTQREARYKAQFAALETALSKAQTQQSWLTGQLAGLSSS